MTIQNPCKGICKLHPEYKVCVGCFRTRLEKLQWNTASDLQKQNILLSIAQKQKIYGDINEAT